MVYCIEMILNPIKVKVKPTFIVNIFSFKFIYIFWFIRYLFCRFHWTASDIFNMGTKQFLQDLYIEFFLVYFGMNCGSLKLSLLFWRNYSGSNLLLAIYESWMTSYIILHFLFENELLYWCIDIYIRFYSEM